MDKMSIIVRYSKIFSERKLKEYDLSFPEQIIIMFLSAHTEVNQDAISKYYMIDKGAIAKTVGRLESKEYIVRKQNPTNKRENLISLSEKGRTLIANMWSILDEWNNIIYKGMSDEEIETVKRLTNKMADNATEFIDAKNKTEEQKETN